MLQLNFSQANAAHKWYFSTKTNEPHAYGEFSLPESEFHESVLTEIAVGQTVGTWEETYVSEHILLQKCAKFVSARKVDSEFPKIAVTLAFPWSLWQGNLSWLVTICFGKMSFYPNLEWSSLSFDTECFSQTQQFPDTQQNKLRGPLWSFEKTCAALGSKSNSPLLMGILKPNVAMNAKQISELVVEAASSGCHIVKDDEIRFDESFEESLSRVEKIANAKARLKEKCWYVAHIPGNPQEGELSIQQLVQLQNAGADALLWNSWPNGIASLQKLRSRTPLPLFSHPAFAGVFSASAQSQKVCPSVSLGSLLSAAGADFLLFPSPYGKVSLTKLQVQKLKSSIDGMQFENVGTFSQSVLVPSAGIVPEHVPLAKQDFGIRHVLNAGTAIFATNKNQFIKPNSAVNTTPESSVQSSAESSIRISIKKFREAMKNAYTE